MKTPNTGVETAQNQSKVGAIKGLSAKIVTAIAALGIATSAEKVEAATLLSFTGTTQISGIGTSETYPGLNKSRIITTTIGTLNVMNEGKSRFTLNVPSAGTLVISWVGTVGTGANFSNFAEDGYPNTSFDVNQVIQFGLSSGAMTTIDVLGDNEGLSTYMNDGNREISNAEGFVLSRPQPQSATLSLAAGGTYNFDNIVQATNVPGAAEVNNLSFSFTPIPETGTTAMLGAALVGGLMIRRREKKQENI